MMGQEFTPSDLADDTKLGGVADTADGCATIQGDLNCLEKWADRNLMNFNKREMQSSVSASQIHSDACSSHLQ